MGFSTKCGHLLSEILASDITQSSIGVYELMENQNPPANKSPVVSPRTSAAAPISSEGRRSSPFLNEARHLKTATIVPSPLTKRPSFGSSSSGYRNSKIKFEDSNSDFDSDDGLQKPTTKQKSVEFKFDVAGDLLLDNNSSRNEIGANINIANAGLLQTPQHATPSKSHENVTSGPIPPHESAHKKETSVDIPSQPVSKEKETVGTESSAIPIEDGDISADSVVEEEEQKQSSGGSRASSKSSLGGLDYIAKLQYRFRNLLHRAKCVYLDYVSFRKETVLYLLLVLPVVVSAWITMMLNQFSFDNTLNALLFKALVIVFGILAVHSIDIINLRLARVKHISYVLNNRATAQSIFEVQNYRGKSNILFYLSWIFYGIHIATELDVEHTPKLVYLSNGTANYMMEDFSNGDPDTQNNVLISGLGSTFSCFNCAGLETSQALFVPLSVNLLFVGSQHEDATAIMYAEQDIVVLTVQCFTLEETNLTVTDHGILFNTTNLTKGVGTTNLVMNIAANYEYGTDRVAQRRCSVVAYDRSGYAAVLYGMTAVGSAARIKVESITPNDKDCMNTFGYCLEMAKREDLSYSMLHSFFPEGSIEIDQDYSLTSGFFPDPTIPLNDELYSIYVRNSLANLLLVSTRHFNADGMLEVELYTDELAVTLKVGRVLQILTVAISAVLVLFVFFLTFVTIMGLGKSSNTLLRRLEIAMYAGKDSTAYLSYFVEKEIEDGNWAWDQTLLRFGENRETIQESTGRLIFAQKRDVVRFKNNRMYK